VIPPYTDIELSPILNSPVSLYVHIPFCSEKCGYCDFFSRPVKSFETVEAVLQAEIRELAYFIEKTKPERIGTLYIGGGTPSMVPRNLLAPFLTSLRELLPSLPEEFSVEANPESIDEEFIEILARQGAGRISIGIQSFDDKYLSLIGRRASSEINHKALQLLSRSWKGEINIDVMYGYPGQTKKEALHDLDTAVEVDPGHLSLYALTAEDHTPLSDFIRNGTFPPIDTDAQEKIWRALHSRLTEKEFSMYEISNYSKPGKESHHNLVYWTLQPYIGIGPGGVSSLPFEIVDSGETGCVRLTGSEDFSVFSEEPFDRASRKIPQALDAEVLSPRDFLFDYIHMGFRMNRGISRKVFSEIFSAAPESFFPETFAKYARRMRMDAQFLRLDDIGLRFLNTFLIDCLTELDKTGWKGPFYWPSKVRMPVIC
jgi:oxygen-independent coproporphyrinogen-3 oxidase